MPKDFVRMYINPQSLISDTSYNSKRFKKTFTVISKNEMKKDLQNGKLILLMPGKKAECLYTYNLK